MFSLTSSGLGAATTGMVGGISNCTAELEIWHGLNNFIYFGLNIAFGIGSTFTLLVIIS